MGNRNGKHKEGKVRLGLYLDPRDKALAAYLSQITGMSMTDIVLDGIVTLAKAKGVITQDGKIMPAHMAGFDVQLQFAQQSKVKG